ncbi:hypothetical protein QC764_404990 [Podospora pseudoanserina]|uniref:OsmC-like protein n=1 Tax=Podospora pseudoanserina TaxID=2609844 RepID=A0ABR0IBE9_9PEZI|nr:hypothetical protein QC764_404990 [Podospora pseudoanserina]
MFKFTTRLTTTARQATRRRFSTTPARFQILPVKVTGTGTGTLQKVSVPGKPYTFTADTYPVLGGADSAPSPVVYSLASLSACNQVTGSVVASNHGIKLGKWDTDVEGDKFDKFVSEVERRCPITQLFKLSGVKYESEWVNEKL